MPQDQAEAEKSSKTVSDELPEIAVQEPPMAPPPLIHEFHEHEGRRWPTIIVYLLLALVAAFLIVLAAKAIYNAVKDDNVKPPAQTGEVPKPPAETKPKTKPSGTSAQTTPNTGPGSVIALAAGIGLAAGGLHYLYTLRKRKD